MQEELKVAKEPNAEGMMAQGPHEALIECSSSASYNHHAVSFGVVPPPAWCFRTLTKLSGIVSWCVRVLPWLHHDRPAAAMFHIHLYLI